MSTEPETLDCTNISCPMPIVRISSAIRAMNSGDELRVVATDSAFEADVRAWAKISGNTIMHFQDADIKEVLIRLK